MVQTENMEVQPPGSEPGLPLETAVRKMPGTQTNWISTPIEATKERSTLNAAA